MKKYIIALSGLLFTFKAHATTVEETFDVEIGIFDAAKVHMAYTLTETDYTFSSQIETAGLFDKFYSFKASYLTSGFFDKSSLITQKYHQFTQSSAHKRSKYLVFNPQGTLTKRISTKDDQQKEVDITLPQTKIDNFDIQTALTKLIKNFSKTNSCDLNQTVFNGKKVYHITVKDSGRTLLREEKLPVKGQAYECIAFIHQEQVTEGDLLWQVSSERSIKFYLMLDKATDLPFLAKMEIASTPLGKLEAYMTDLNIKE